MVKRVLLLALSAATLLCAPLLSAKETDYHTGDIAEADIVAPVPLVVVDAEATLKLREREAQRIPVIYRFCPGTSEEIETAFRSTFAATRSNFLAALELKLGQRQLDPPSIAATNFRAFITSFQKQNVLFPVGTNLAALWAGGNSGAEVESAFVAPLRETIRVYIREDVSPPDIKVGSTLRLVSLANNEAITARLVQERGNNLSKTSFVSLPRAKSELQDRFPPEEREAAKYLASFVRPNCLLEADLTREMRAQRTDGMVSVEHYEPGQVIVRQGQVIDQKALAALNQLKEKTAVGRLQQLAPEVPDSRKTAWLVAALSGGFLLLLLIVRALARRRPASLLPVPIHSGPAELSGDSWRERALRAEQHAQKAQVAARAGVMAHIARWLTEKMTQKLITQRSQLLDSHQSAAIEIAELEARLEKVHAPLQDRLQAYERRIAELEKELVAKGDVNRELINAKIEIARKQLEIERSKSRLEFN